MPALNNTIHVLEYTSCDGAFNVSADAGTLPGPSFAPEIPYTQIGRPLGDAFVVFRHLEVPGPLSAAQTAHVVDYLRENYQTRRGDAFGHTTIVVAALDDPHRDHVREYLEHVPCPYADCRTGLLAWILDEDLRPGQSALCPHCERRIAVPNPRLWVGREQCLTKPPDDDVSIWQSREGDTVLVLAHLGALENPAAGPAAEAVLEVLMDEPMCYLELLWHDICRQNREYRRVVRGRLGELGHYLRRETKRLLPALRDTTILAKADAEKMNEFAVDAYAGICEEELNARRLKYFLAIDQFELELEKDQVAHRPVRSILAARLQSTEVAVKQIDLDLELLEQPLDTARWASERYQSWLQQGRADKFTWLGLFVGVILGIAAIWPAAIAHDDERLQLRWITDYWHTFGYMALPLAILIAGGLGVVAVGSLRRLTQRWRKRRPMLPRRDDEDDQEHEA